MCVLGNLVKATDESALKPSMALARGEKTKLIKRIIAQGPILCLGALHDICKCADLVH